MERDLLGFHLAVLDIDLVADENNWDGLANSGQVFVPFWHVRVSDAGADIKHDDAAITTNVVTITKSSELLLASGVPNVKKNLAMVSEKGHWVHFNSECSDVLLLKLASQMTFDKGCLANSSVTDKHQLEFWNLSYLLNHLYCNKLVNSNKSVSSILPPNPANP